MNQKRTYLEPQAVWSLLMAQALICDSYDSGIDDVDYEDVDWTVQP